VLNYFKPMNIEWILFQSPINIVCLIVFMIQNRLLENHYLLNFILFLNSLLLLLEIEVSLTNIVYLFKIFNRIKYDQWFNICKNN